MYSPTAFHGPQIDRALNAPEGVFVENQGRCDEAVGKVQVGAPRPVAEQLIVEWIW